MKVILLIGFKMVVSSMDFIVNIANGDDGDIQVIGI